MRLIDADELKKVIETYRPIKVFNDFSAGKTNMVNYCLDEIDNAPTVPQGEWINHRNDYGHNIADCSLCGKATQWHDEDEDGIPRYCWYCGADMRGGAE